MSKKRSYQRTSVNKLSSEAVKDRAIELGGSGTCVGLDIAKREIVVVVRWASDEFEKPWSVKNPNEIDSLVELLVMLKEICGSLTVGLESTGNYGEAVRRAMTEAFIEVHRVSGKAVSDYKEIFDGVPSQHDGKDAAMIAELTAFGKGTAWPYEPMSEADQEICHQVDRLDAFRLQANQWLCRLEGLLSRYWPEVTGLLALSSKTLLRAIVHYGSPARLAADPDAARRLLGWGRGQLKTSKIEAIIQSARHGKGAPINEAASTWLVEVAQEVLQAFAQIDGCGKRLRNQAAEHDGMKKYVKAVGAVTLCVLWRSVGDPRQYHSSGALLKALGLNLKELSSGKRNGELAITKRGPSLARKWLYYWALRAVQEDAVRQWYTEFCKVGKQTGNRCSEHRKMKGLVAAMRKLCRSLWYVMHHDLEFDYDKVFPGRPLPKPDTRSPPARRRAAAVTQCHVN